MDTDLISYIDEMTFCDAQNADYLKCNNCQVIMVTAESYLECPNCGVIKEIELDIKDKNETPGNSLIKVSLGGYSTFSGAMDSGRSQRKQIMDQLMQLNEKNKHNIKIPKNILESCAKGYNEIQKLVIDKLDKIGEICGQKRFVRRGNVKNEILGAWLYYECLLNGLPRKKKDIALFMNLPNDGISAGEGVLRALHNEKKIKLPINLDPSPDIIKRYIKNIGISEKSNNFLRYCNFTEEILNLATQYKIGITSINNSKIIGIIWILIEKERLDISKDQLEILCDNTKKTTFMKFAKLIGENIEKFYNIFEKYGINHGIKGCLVLCK